MTPSRRLAPAVLAALAAIPLAVAQTPDAGSGIEVTVQGAPVDTAPILRDSRVLVPLRGVFEAMNARVNYDQTSRTITAERQGRTTELTIGDGLSGSDAPAMMVDGTAMVPLRYFAENLGATVRWDSARRAVSIEMPATVIETGGSAQGMTGSATQGAAGAYSPDAAGMYSPDSAQMSATAYAPDAAGTMAPPAPTPPSTAAGAAEPMRARPVPVADSATETTAPSPLVQYLPWIVLGLVALAAAAIFLARKGQAGRVIAADDTRK